MKITAYRICRSPYAGAIWSGAGARDYGGRWNSKGIAVVYASQSRALAAIEQLVHVLPPRVLDDFVVASIAFDQRQVQTLEMAKLPRNWSHPVAPVELKQFGDGWIAAGRFPVLAVPSAVVVSEFNYLINPAHPSFGSMPKSPVAPFVFDSRLR